MCPDPWLDLDDDPCGVEAKVFDAVSLRRMRHFFEKDLQQNARSRLFSSSLPLMNLLLLARYLSLAAQYALYDFNNQGRNHSGC